MINGEGLRRGVVQLPQRLLILAVRGYRLLLKPWLGNACRFEPTCSAYALQALQQHGASAGTMLAAGRLLRCHPWCAGGCDPVPVEAPRLFAIRITSSFCCKMSGDTPATMVYPPVAFGLFPWKNVIPVFAVNA